MQVHLSKPGGQREGPLTVEQINRDLAARKYNDSDYWAWYEGLESWVPLHAVPGIKAPSASGTTHFVPPPQEQPQVEPQHDEQPQEDQYAIATESWQAPAEAENGHDSGEQEDASQKSSRSEGETALIEPESDQTEQARFEPSSEMVEREESENQVDSETTLTEPASDQAEVPEPSADLPAKAVGTDVSSGLPSEALEQIFVFTSGAGPALRESGVMATMMLEIIGENPDNLRDRVPRDIFGNCNVGERIRTEGKVPGSAWRAMASLRPELVEQAKQGAFRTCVRTFSTESQDLVAVFLFYNKTKT